MQITIGELLNFLENTEWDFTNEYSFTNGHSYRGMYDCLSVEPREGDAIRGELGSVKHMIEVLNKALDRSYTGWKGGEYYYDVDTPVFFAYEGCTESGVGCHEYSEPSEIRHYFYNLIHKENDNV